MISRTRPAPNQTNPAVTVTTTYSYDALNRSTGQTYSDGTTPTVYLAYDLASVWGSTVNGIGRLTLEETYLGSTTYTATVPWNLDAMGRPQSVGVCTPTPANCAAAYVLGYTYDFLGDVTSSTNGLGLSLSYFYNVAQRLTSVVSSLSDTNHPGLLYSGVQYNAEGAVTQASFGNSGSSLTETRTYDGRLRLTGISDGSLYSWSVPSVPTNGYLGNSSLGQTNDSVNGTWNFGYDAFNRLSAANLNNGQAYYTYAYDRFGNRWQQTGPQTMNLSFSGNNNHMDPGTVGYTYDAAGNLTYDGNHHYTYDAENRIIAVDGGTTASYVYDAEGQRVPENRKRNDDAISLRFEWERDCSNRGSR